MRRSIICTLTAIMISLGLASPAQSAIVQYSISFDGSISGPSGIGSFLWDTDTNNMSIFEWDFGNGNTGGMLESTLDANHLGGGTTGAQIFEIITGQDVYPNTATDIALGGGTYGVFPDGMGFDGINHSSTPSRYLLFDPSGLTIGGGTYFVEAVVPVPAAVWLFGSGLIGLVGVARRKKA